VKSARSRPATAKSAAKTARKPRPSAARVR
jgi:hypothetical protein